jgi:hypothetical protein
MIRKYGGIETKTLKKMPQDRDQDRKLINGLRVQGSIGIDLK